MADEITPEEELKKPDFNTANVELANFVPTGIEGAATPAAPAPEPAPAATPPPAWADVKSGQDFQDLSPEKKLVAFDRWHNDSYNYAIKLPDWDEHAAEFNQKAYDTQVELSKAAGGVTPAQARYNLAKQEIAGGRTEDQLPEDIRAAYKNPPQDDSLIHKILNTGRVAGSDVGAGIEHAIGGLFAESADAAAHPGMLQRFFENVIGDPLNVSAQNKAGAASALNDVASYFDTRAKAAATESGVDPNLENTGSAKAAHLLASFGTILGEAAIPEVGLPLLLSHNALQRYGEVFDQTGDPAKAEAAKNISLLGNGLFMGQGAGVIQGLEKILPEGGNAIKNWAIKASAATAGNVGTNQLIKASESAVEAEPGKRMEAFTKALGDIVPADVVTAAAFGIQGAGLPVAKAAAAPAPEVDAANEAGAPETAKAIAENVVDLAPPKAPEPSEPQAKLNVDIDNQGNLQHSLDISADATMDQVSQVAKDVEAAGLPEAVKQGYRDRINQELLQRAGVGGAAEVAPKSEKIVPLQRYTVKADTTIEGAEQTGVSLIVEGTTPEEALAMAKRMGTNVQEDTLKAEPTAPEAAAPTESTVAERTAAELDKRPAGITPEVRDLAEAYDPNLHMRRAKGDMPTPDEYRQAASAARPAGSFPLEGGGYITSEGKTVAPEGAVPTRAAEPAEAAVPTRVADRPIPEPAAPPSEEDVAKTIKYEKQPPRTEEQIAEGTEELRQEALKKGTITRLEVQQHPDVGQVASSKVLASIRAELAEKYPVQTEPPAGTEAVTPDTHAATEDKLPKIKEGDVVRPMYTNDPKTTALQIDAGADTTPAGKGERIYIPDELVDNEQVNPAIKFAFEKETGKPYVTGVEDRYGHTPEEAKAAGLPAEKEGQITEPGQFTKAYKADPAVEEASLRQTKGKEFQLTPETEEFQTKLNKRRATEGELSPEETQALQDFTKQATTRLTDKDPLVRERLVTALTDLGEEQIRRKGVEKAFLSKDGRDASAKMIRNMEATLAGHPGRTESIEGLTEGRGEDAVASELLKRGLKPELVDYNAVPGEMDSVIPAISSTNTPLEVQRNFTALDNIGVIGKPGEVISKDPIGTGLRSISTDNTLPDRYRVMAKEILNSKVKTDGLGLTLGGAKMVAPRPGSENAAGWYHLDNKNIHTSIIDINPNVNHEGGVVGTFLHEAGHHVTLVKMQPDYARNAIEERAFQNLRLAHTQAVAETFKSEFGRTGSTEELALFQRSHGYQGADALKSLVKATGKEHQTKRDYYGLSNLDEFVTEVMSNGRFQELLSRIQPIPEVGRPRGRIANLLQVIRDSIKELFAGRTIAKGSLLDQTLDNTFKFIKSPIDQAKIGARAVPEAATLPADRVALEKQVQAAHPDVDTNTMTLQEMQELLGGKTEERAQAEEGKITGSGWLDKNGKFIAAPGEMQHRETAEALFPDQAKKLSSMSLGQLYDFMNKKGYARVQHDVQEIYTSGELSTAQRRVLEDAGKEQGVNVLHDFGLTAKRIYSTGDAFDLPASTEPTIKIKSSFVGGKQTHELNIQPNATRADMLQMHATLTKSTHISPEEKTRLVQELNDQLGPTVTFSKGKDKVVYGYDSANNIANTLARRERNSLALDFGGEKSFTKDTIKDVEAMPFIIEAAGDRNDLITGLNRVSNAKNPDRAAPFIELLQHAVDNFDRLNAKSGRYREAMKSELEQERAAGFSIGAVDDYVMRILSGPEGADSTVLPTSGAAGSRSFVKGRVFEKLYDAIAEDYVPKTQGTAGPTNILDLTQRRIELGQRLIQGKILENELRSIKAQSDNRPIIGNTEEYETLGDKTDTRVPHGYTMVMTGAKPLVVHNDYVKIFKQVYADSTLPDVVQGIYKYAGFAKRYTLILDTFHVGRIGLIEAAYSKGASRVGYNKGLSLLEYKLEDLDRAVKSGEINQKMADYSREHYADAQDLLKFGLNAGKVADNLFAEHTVAIPYLKAFNPWVFQKLSRGAMMQTAVENLQRNLKRFPELGRDGNLRRTAKEMNEVFGNLQKQGLFRTKNYQDLVRVTALAPQWTESRVKAEARGYGQIARAVGELATGKARLGVVGQGQLTIILGMLAANQVVNFLSTGHSTFQNKEGHRLDAFIPDFSGGKRGFWFNPFEIGGEYAFMAQRYFSQHMTPIDALTQIASNKLSPLGRAGKSLITGRDWAGRPFENTFDRVKATLIDALPSPLPLTGVIEKDPRATIGYRWNRQPGIAEKQTLQSFGVKVAPEMSPRSEMFALAYPFRADKSYRDPSQYTELRRALDNDQLNNAASELRHLASTGHTLDQLRAAVGITTAGTIASEKFTGGTTAQERVFVRAMTPDQKELYKQAQKDHKDNANKLRKLLTQMRPELNDQLRKNKHPKTP